MKEMTQFLLSPSQIRSFVIILIVCISCTTKKREHSNFNLSMDEHGRLETLHIMQGTKEVLYRFDSLGNCKRITHYKDHLKDGEELSFTNSSLTQKIHYKLDLIDGYAFDFYKGSGAIKAYRQLKFGKERDLGLDYYDMNVPVVKSSLYFNNAGEIYFKQNFDSMSRLIGDEGKKPSFMR